MPSIYDLKPRFQNLLRPSVTRLHARGVTANQVTLFACAISIVVGAVVAILAEHRAVFALLPLWMLLRMGLNAVDGMLAREFGQQSRLGAYLNEIADLVADAALYLPFACLAGVYGAAVGAVVLLAWLSEYAGVLGLMVGASRRYDGPMGKSDRAFVFGLLGFLLAIGIPVAPWLTSVMAVLAALLVYTTYNRVKRGLAERPAS
ncbi:CDP-alcohol phosphatidyltransferase family protein [Pseudomonas sp. GV071]|uniref:CDP-alcohol phosphatidyltransferase family protein n=1 Tax=Pseudomonas sp. GV071 TaxID=2135754 RepID=UPI000D33AFDE|nr:CDP-alcohol phosphatidyltransferase family protein [Pseudomonas sp. GV071]PTQ73025.1 CDP-diacylglycerol--glycerol-3-phosphate 3-phosphatidyltransferase [Pseudomonas sp. GV071]